MDKTKAAEPACAPTKSSDIGQFKVRSVSQDHISNQTVAGQKNSHLAAKLSGNGRNVLCKLRGYDLVRGNAPSEDAFKSAALRLFDAESITVN
jgi:hypothetical protein